MKKSVVILVIVLVVTTAIVGIIVRSGSPGTDDGDKMVQIPEVVTEAGVDTESAVESVTPANADAGVTGEIVEDSSNLSRGYIDVDQSGDWSEGDIALETCDDGYMVPLE